MLVKGILIFIALVVSVNVISLAVTSFVFVNIAASSPETSPQAATLEFLKGFKRNLEDAEIVWDGDDYCKWRGVHCEKNGEVRVRLNDMELEGELPPVNPDWGSYVQVTELNLSGNPGLGGEFEESWKHLIHLRKLDLSRTSLYGRIPSTWQEMHSLETVYIHSTAACESIPRWLQGNLPNLKRVDFSYNNFYGLLPDTWGNFFSLRFFNISNNHFCGCLPSSWSRGPLFSVATFDTSLTLLNCSQNTCMEYNKCPAAPRMDGGGQESNTDPSENGSSPGEENGSNDGGSDQGNSHHDNSNNGGGGGGNSEGGGNEEEIVSYGDDKCTLKLLNEFKKELRSLQVTWSGLSDNYCSWPHVECRSKKGSADHEVYLLLSELGLYGEMPEVDDDWGFCSKVVHIDLSRNNIYDDLEEDWKELRNLRYINLSYTNVDDKLPKDWHKLVNLQTLDLSYTHIRGKLEDDWKRMSNLKYLDLSYTHIDGVLPNKWGTMNSLETLYLNNANLCGGLPSWDASTMSNLKVVRLQNNKFKGDLASSWGTLSLTELDISGNNWCGCLPSSWRNNEILLNAAVSSGSDVMSPNCGRPSCKNKC